MGHSKGTSCRTPLAKILDPPLPLTKNPADPLPHIHCPHSLSIFPPYICRRPWITLIYYAVSNKQMALNEANGLEVLLSSLKKVIDRSDWEHRVDAAVCLIRCLDLLLTALSTYAHPVHLITMCTETVPTQTTASSGSARCSTVSYC